MKVSWIHFWRHKINFSFQSQHKWMRVVLMCDCETLKLSKLDSKLTLMMVMIPVLNLLRTLTSISSVKTQLF